MSALPPPCNFPHMWAEPGARSLPAAPGTGSSPPSIPAVNSSGTHPWPRLTLPMVPWSALVTGMGGLKRLRWRKGLGFSRVWKLQGYSEIAQGLQGSADRFTDRRNVVRGQSSSDGPRQEGTIRRSPYPIRESSQ